MKVLEGKQGWLFIDNDTNRVIEQHTGALRLLPEPLDRWRQLVQRRMRVSEALGKPYVFLVAPDAHAIYPELLPDHIVPVPRRPVHDLLDVCKSAGFDNVLYPLDEMQAGKAVMTVGHSTDSHWSHYGAWCVYLALMEKVRALCPNVAVLDPSRILFRPASKIGDLGAQMEPQLNGTTVVSHIDKPKARLVSDNQVKNRGSIVIYENEDKSLPSALMFRDSYGVWFRHFLAESFSRLVLVATPLYEDEIVRRENPDIVITEMAERFLINVPDDESGEKVDDIIAAKEALETGTSQTTNP